MDYISYERSMISGDSPRGQHGVFGLYEPGEVRRASRALKTWTRSICFRSTGNRCKPVKVFGPAARRAKPVSVETLGNILQQAVCT